MQRFLSQPFAVAEQFTGVPGVMVGIGRNLDQYAGIGCAGVYYSRCQSDDLHQEGFQTASGLSLIHI